MARVSRFLFVLLATVALFAPLQANAFFGFFGGGFSFGFGGGLGSWWGPGYWGHPWHYGYRPYWARRYWHHRPFWWRHRWGYPLGAYGWPYYGLPVLPPVVVTAPATVETPEVEAEK